MKNLFEDIQNGSLFVSYLVGITHSNFPHWICKLQDLKWSKAIFSWPLFVLLLKLKRDFILLGGFDDTIFLCTNLIQYMSK